MTHADLIGSVKMQVEGFRNWNLYSCVDGYFKLIVCFRGNTKGKITQEVLVILHACYKTAVFAY